MYSKTEQFNLWGLLNWIAMMVSSYFQIAQFLWKRTFEKYSIYAHFFRIVKILWTSLHNFCSNLSSNIHSQYHNFMLYCEVFRNSSNQNSKVSNIHLLITNLKSQIFLKHWESCPSSATYDLWLKAESWSLNFKILKNHSII